MQVTAASAVLKVARSAHGKLQVPMIEKWKKGLTVLLLAFPYLVTPAVAQPSFDAPTLEELAFQEAVGRRSPFAVRYIDQDPFLLKRIEALLRSKRISGEISGAALARSASYGDIELVYLLV